MRLPPRSLFAGRGFARRVVELPCELVLASYDVPLLAWGTNLSESGIFLETGTPVTAGEAAVVSFQPMFGWRGEELSLFAEIARSAPGRRRDDGAAGLGLRFLDLGRAERRALTRWLRPRPRVGAGVRRVPLLEPPPIATHPFAARVA